MMIQTSNAIDFPILDIQGISGGYAEFPLIQRFYLSLESGSWLSLVGPNGSGKSTILKLIGRILKPLSGSVYLNGKSIQTQTPQATAS